MDWGFRGRSLVSPSEESNGFSFDSKVSPSVLLIIMILAVIFFVSGLLHLLVRFLMKPPYRDHDEDGDGVTVLQGQLQQLFHLHDAGLDQSFIDTLPVFQYKAITGSKTPFDCAVCLCEFEGEDKLRFLPKCSHAFHMECIDTWLLSHSTCPLCRSCLLPDFSPNTTCSPFVYVLESDNESSAEIVSDRFSVLRSNSHLGRTSSVLRSTSNLGFHGGSEFGSSRIEITAIDESVPSKEKVVHVKLGKFRNVDVGNGECSSNKNVDERRCFSMGSFAYVMDENLVLQVPIRTPMKKQSGEKVIGHRAAMSECDCESKRQFNSFDAVKIVEAHGSASHSNNNANDGERNKRESFSISKIWMRGKKEQTRASSFHFPAQSSAIKDTNRTCAGRTISEMNIGRLENGGSEFDENHSCNSLDSQPHNHSFARKTLLWLVGRQNKVIHSSFSTHA